MSQGYCSHGTHSVDLDELADTNDDNISGQCGTTVPTYDVRISFKYTKNNSISGQSGT